MSVVDVSGELATGVDAPRFETRFDAVPEFWQFLNGLSPDDVVAELVQNDIDAKATNTRFSFDEHELVCEGDGQPVDEDGWLRLSYIRGAGYDVPRKRNQIGVKNHGLKACFTIGDDIRVSSAGRYIRQTLYGHSDPTIPHPGAMPVPHADTNAPAEGCRVEVPYRRNKLITTVGETFSFEALTQDRVTELFKQACEFIPRQFIGTVCPTRPNYWIEVSHWVLGTARFEFSTRRPKKVGRFLIFSRECKVAGDTPDLPSSLKETVAMFRVSPIADFKRDIPDFFRRPVGCSAEISWRVSKGRRPVAERGLLRYPITYPDIIETSRTGVGVHYCGPFVSDVERHGLGHGGTEFNSFLLSECDDALVDILRLLLIPRHGAKALSLLCDPMRESNERLVGLLNEVIKKRAIPVVRYGSRARTGRGKNKAAKRSKHTRRRITFMPTKAPTGASYQFVVPSWTWEKDRLSDLLASLCPADEHQIHLEVPNGIVSVLAGGSCEDFCKTHITFDENDVLARLNMPGGKYFKWNSQEAWRQEFSDPTRAHSYLDVIHTMLKPASASEDKDWEEVRANLCLPDTISTPRPFAKLYSGLAIPHDIPGVSLPWLIHTRLAKHPLFRRRGWTLNKFSFSDFLKASRLHEADQMARSRFWGWLRDNLSGVPQSAVGDLSKLPIWPDLEGDFGPIAHFCSPKKQSIGRLVAEVVPSPHGDLRKLKEVKIGGRGYLAIRTVPSPQEVERWLEGRLDSFPMDRRLEDYEIERFHDFERDVATLTSEKRIASILGRLNPSPPALGRDGYLSAVEELHLDTKDIEALVLQDVDMIDRRARRLDHFFPPRTKPSLIAVVNALRSDPRNAQALRRRLATIKMTALNHEDVLADLEDIPCIPVNGQFFAPSALAFIGNQGDFWGHWKQKISAKNLSQDNQSLYRMAGVLPSQPTPETSRQFFRWLNEQHQSTLETHIIQILRHFGHHRGAFAWWTDFPEIPCLPVRTREGIRLASYRETIRGRTVLLDDFPELADAALQRDDGLKLVIDLHPKLRQPITPRLRSYDVKSLRSAIGEPRYVSGSEPGAAREDLVNRLSVLQSSRFQEELHKRLNGLEVPPEYVRHNWHNRVSQIEALRTSDVVTASFLLRRKLYPVDVSFGFDETTKTLWLKQGTANIDQLFFEAMGQRIFHENAPRWTWAVLEQAVLRDFEERSYEAPEGYTRTPADGEVLEPGGEEEPEPDEGEGDITEVPGGHRPIKPDPTKNVPSPRPLTREVISSRTPPAGGNGTGRASPPPPSPATSPSPALEQVQTAELKNDHYAYHCQMCLTLRPPGELAPPGSYVEHQELRRMLIDAHHVDLKGARGARHAGNLLILCRLHHDNYGRQLTSTSAQRL